MTALAAARADRLTVALRAIGPREAEGTVVGHPDAPTVRSRRDGDSLAIRVTFGERVIGSGVLALDLGDDGRRLWAGEIMLDATNWWVTSPCGTGALRFSHPRGPGRGAT